MNSQGGFGMLQPSVQQMGQQPLQQQMGQQPLQQQQQQTLQTVDHSRSRVLSAPTLLFGDFLIAAGHRRSRQSHELKAVVDHHVRHSLVWIPHHAEPQLGEHSAVPDGFGVREAQQIVQTRRSRPSCSAPSNRRPPRCGRARCPARTRSTRSA